MLDKSRFYRLFIEMLIFQLALAVALGLKKPSYFVDEIWSFNLANCYMFPAFGNVEGYFYTWLQPDFWRTLVVVEPGKEFSYASVWYNQSQDVLPPFFYAVVHTVSSFFPGIFSNWFILGPNLVFFAGAQIVLLLISKKIYGVTWFALLPCLIYGFTWGSINTILYFRMYMMVTFFGLLAFYLHMLILERLESKYNALGKLFIAIAITNICGFLTHYYYLIYVIFLAMAIMWYMNHKALYPLVLKYLSFNIAALLACVAIFPPCFKQIAGIGEYGYRGAQSMSNAFNSEFFKRVGEYNSLLLKDIGGDLCLLLLLIVSFMVLNRARKEFVDVSLTQTEEGKRINIKFHPAISCYSFAWNSKDLFIILSFVASVPYYLMICKISVMSDDRYVFMVIPLIILCGFYLINRIITAISGKKYLAVIMCVLTVWLAAVASFRAEKIKFADTSISTAVSVVEKEYKDTPILVINGNRHWHPIIEHIFLLEKLPQAYLTTEKEIEKVNDALKAINFQGEKLLVFVTWECKKDIKDIKQELQQETGFKHFLEIYNGGDYKRGKMYLLTK